MDQHRRSKSTSNTKQDEDPPQMRASRKSQLELRNDLVNKEMKTLFKQVVNTNSDDITNLTAIMHSDPSSDTNNNTITLNLVHGKSNQIPNNNSNNNKNNLIYANVNAAKISSQQFHTSNSHKDENINVNFKNAVFNKNFIPMQVMHNESVDTDVTVFSNNISTSDVHLNDDLSLLPVIDDKTLLSSLKAKFEMRKYYSYIGELLVAFNPREKIDIYDDEVKKMYSDSLNRSNQDPHLYWTCAETFRNAKEKQKNYMIVLSGESGSGKTEVSKYAIDFLVNISPQSGPFQNKIQLSNIILEAFGHAPTIFNSNSTRFCKYFELRYNPDGILKGAKIYDYMLEKSRVTLDYPHERNFLIFYYLLAGLDKNTMEKFHLGDIQHHNNIIA
jgi:hypothetical protein